MVQPVDAVADPALVDPVLVDGVVDAPAAEARDWGARLPTPRRDPDMSVVQRKETRGP